MAAADGNPPSGVEDYNYPGAETIFKQKGIKLLRGDGRVLLADCGTSPNEIKVWSRAGDICFQASTTTGYITMELTEVWGLETTSHSIDADLTAGGETQTVNVPKDAFKSVGEGIPGGTPSTLVEIRVTG
ncbi:hypothetical protein EIZ62_08795 [Streptomyces ficellus]|uniref:Uncharacterized protein n=1 Tax=Streptomyces ficellus TaxID=1977088 RepID=A0A6I6FX11_9ACTN|nr:hypothetical protein EIZ62_08795 [Streptomyces ficellus]